MPPKIKQTSTQLDQEINLFEPGQTFAAIDIGTTTAKIAVLKETPVGTRLISIGLAEIPDPITPNETPEELQKKIQTALKNALAQVHGKVKRIITIINVPSLVLKNISLPAMPDAELRESVKWEMEQNIDFPIDSATIDFLVSGETIRAGAKNFELEVVAVPTEDIKKHMEFYLKNRFLFQSVTMPAFCLWNVFQKANQWKESDTIALLDLGAHTTKINIFSNNVLRFSREILFGGETITAALAKEMNLAATEAEEQKIKFGVSDKAAHYSCIVDSLKQLAGQIDRSFGYYKAQFHIERIDRLVIYGGSAKLLNLDKFLSEELGIFTEIGNPFNGLLFDQRAFANLDEFDAFFAVAIGAAINSGDVKRINLLPAEFRKDTRLEIKKKLFTIVPVAVIAALLIVYVNLVKKEKNLTREKAEKEAIITAWKNEQEIKRKLDFLESIPSTQKSWINLLRGLSEVIPEGVWLDSVQLEESKKTIVLKGASESNILVIDFVRKLEALPWFSSVKLESVEEKINTSTPLTYFKITIGKK
ncbi:MAG: type IV pilus assembly protein PilM [Candidatus Omnitrophica bacterium]|nr:type IV pilus assembly protein PilM [Candidatus Omnitrophota bacterium]